MSRAHHNCLMTKHPHYGSLTNWHRDIRFWSFAREDLVSAWFALGKEEVDNGALWFVPGSHRMAFDADRFDEAKFFRTDRADNGALISTARSPRLAPGDAVFFHCNTLHSAGKNHERCREVLPGLHLPWPKQRTEAGHSFGCEAGSSDGLKAGAHRWRNIGLAFGFISACSCFPARDQCIEILDRPGPAEGSAAPAYVIVDAHTQRPQLCGGLQPRIDRSIHRRVELQQCRQGVYGDLRFGIRR